MSSFSVFLDFLVDLGAGSGTTAAADEAEADAAIRPSFKRQ